MYVWGGVVWQHVQGEKNFFWKRSCSCFALILMLRGSKFAVIYACAYVLINVETSSYWEFIFPKWLSLCERPFLSVGLSCEASCVHYSAVVCLWYFWVILFFFWSAIYLEELKWLICFEEMMFCFICCVFMLICGNYISVYLSEMVEVISDCFSQKFAKGGDCWIFELAAFC